MTKPVPIRQRDVAVVRRVLSKGAADAAEQLQSLIGRPIRSAAALREWHDALLFALAHVPDATLAPIIEDELRRVSLAASALVGASESAALALTNSGIAGTPVEGVFSYALVRFLLDRWPDQVQLAAIDAPVPDVRELLRGLLPAVERETPDLLDDNIETLCTTLLGRAPLATLTALLEQAPVSEHIRAVWFARLQVRVRVTAAATGCSMTESRGPRGAMYAFNTPFLRAVDVPDVVAQPIDAPIPLRTRERAALIDTARTVLATLERETDPVTFAGDVELHDMGRGLRIALYHLAPSYRLPFDSYVGFMAFRNGVALAYGGAWIFPGRSKIGINVFEAQRGGESAWFFAQLLRLYARMFSVPCFEVENYQLGYGNADGLRSGAYWFYYRLGFRPVTAPLQSLASREFARLGAKSGYEVPLATLRTLVAEGLVLHLTVDEAGAHTHAPMRTGEPGVTTVDTSTADTSTFDTAALTLAVQSHIVSRYAGDRSAAMQTALLGLHHVLPLEDYERWHADERSALELWALAIDVIPDLERWTAAERRALVRLIKSKGAATETEHQRLLAAHTSLLEAWQRYCNDLR